MIHRRPTKECPHEEQLNHTSSSQEIDAEHPHRPVGPSRRASPPAARRNGRQVAATVAPAHGDRPAFAQHDHVVGLDGVVQHDRHHEVQLEVTRRMSRVPPGLGRPLAGSTGSAWGATAVRSMKSVTIQLTLDCNRPRVFFLSGLVNTTLSSTPVHQFANMVPPTAAPALAATRGHAAAIPCQSLANPLPRSRVEVGVKLPRRQL